jgi:hypothetical protein
LKGFVGPVQVLAFLQGAPALNDFVQAVNIVNMKTDWQANSVETAVST